MTIRSNKLSPLGVAVAGGVVSVVVYFVLCLYTYPLADDFSLAVLGRTFGFFGSVKLCYLTMGGRWVTYVWWIALWTFLDPTKWYLFIVLAFGFFYLATLYIFLRRAFTPDLSRIRALAAASCALALIWSGMPDPGEGLFWLGGYSDGLGVPLTLVLLLAVMTPPQGVGRSRVRKVLYGAGVGFLAVLLAGTQELSGLAACLIFGTAWVLAMRDGSERRWLSAALVGCVVGLLIALAAPGNMVRSVCYPDRWDIARTLRLTWEQLEWFGWKWVRSPQFWAVTLMTLVWCKEWPRPRWFERRAQVLRWVIPSMTALLILARFAAPSWGMGAPAPGRSACVTFVIFLFGWVLSLVLWGEGAAGWLDRREKLRRVLKIVAPVFLGLTLALAGNSGKGLLELVRGRPQAWHEDMTRRDRMVREAVKVGVKDITVPRPTRQRVFSRVDIKEAPDYWINQEVARFYGAESIRLAPVQMEKGSAGP